MTPYTTICLSCVFSGLAFSVFGVEAGAVIAAFIGGLNYVVLRGGAGLKHSILLLLLVVTGALYMAKPLTDYLISAGIIENTTFVLYWLFGAGGTPMADAVISSVSFYFAEKIRGAEK